jgi:hypothetical protein
MFSVVCDIVPTSGANYTTGGDTITPQSVGLTQILRGDAEPTLQAATVGPSAVTVLPQTDGTAKLKSMVAAGTGENSSNANLSATSVRATLYGY